MNQNLSKEQKNLLEMLYRQYADKLYKFARLKVKDTDQAYDLLAETFIIAIKRIDVLCEHTNKQAWLYKVMNNKTKEYYSEKIVTNKETKEKITVQEISYEDIGHYLMLQDTENGYEDIDKKIDNEDTFKQYKDVLSKREYQYLTTRFIEDMTNDETADKIGISHVNGRYIWSNIKRKLSKIIKTLTKLNKKII